MVIENKLDKRLDEILTEENIKALEVFSNNLKVIGRVVNSSRSLLAEKERGITKTRLAEELDLPLRDIEFTPIPMSNKIVIFYLLSELSKEKFTERLTSYNSLFTGTSLQKSLWEKAIYKENEVTKVLYPVSLIVEDQGLVFLLMPELADQKNSDQIWIVCDKKNTGKCVDLVHKYEERYNLLRNKVILYNGEVEIINFREKFSLEEVVLTKEIMEECNLLSNMFRNFERYSKSTPFKRNILFAGIPGTGKTTSANALVRRAIDNKGTVFIFTVSTYMRGSDLVKLYQMANVLSPALVVLEDFDLIARDRDTGAGVTSLLLNLLDGTMKYDNVVTVATTNRKYGLDVAAIRAGRIDKSYTFDYPDMDMKRKLFQIHLKYYGINIDSEQIFKTMQAYMESDITGAMIGSMLLGAKQKATSENRDVTIQDIRFMMQDVKRMKEAVL